MGRDKRAEKPEEQEAVFTTIVGGRPPGAGTHVGAIPRGVEVLLKKASVDAEFRRVLLEQRGDAAHRLDLELTDAERAMLAAIPAEQLERIIDNTKVEPEHRSVFLGGVGRLMLAAVIGVAVVSVMTPSLGHTVSFGITADEVRRHGLLANDPNDPNDPNANSEETHQDQSSAAGDAWQGVSRGIRLD
ncbi:MAG: hypothetical protein RBS72_09000 [Sedimentisphaerales bacterium]|jgi:hypothetical protein|nr:hypothetical protein [Sedimentisphaerales bacterium]NLX20694.1 hypothetical protein [Phycisphaerae bacterium]HNY79163.1 hypothetical protein [Sedimentisphaerales bacterium]HOC64205.1 hypothetical protein [Sedimentisphaerales bacterium]HOH65071.1 hypothetical protein [Sedimentisphaerales bacterium]